MNVLYQILYTLVLILSGLALPFSSKLRCGLRARLGLNKRLKLLCAQWKEPPLWFHFASSGELEQALPIAEEMKQRSPTTPILFTYFSPSGERGLKLEADRRKKARIALPWDGADYLPLDLYCSVKKALDRIRPQKLILINREIWPELLRQCTQRKIPCFLFVTFFPTNKERSLSYLKSSLSKFTGIGTVGQATADMLKRAVPQVRIEAIGDTRIERVLNRRKSQTQAPAWASFFENKNCFLAASVWPQDFEALKPTLLLLARDFYQWRILIVPHEPKEAFIRELQAWGKSENLSLRRFSHFLQSPDENSALIIDSVGILAELYRYSQIAFVGGSFKSRVHNVLEPAAYGNAIVTGPLTGNSFEAMEMNQLGMGLHSFATSAEMNAYLKSLVGDPLVLKEKGQQTQAYLEARLGAAQKYSILLSDF